MTLLSCAVKQNSRFRSLFLQVAQVQLETLKIENQHLNDLLERIESRSPKVRDVSYVLSGVVGTAAEVMI